MKRDPDIIRAIALAAEALPEGKRLNALEGVSKLTFSFHAQLMLDAGLIDGRTQTSSGVAIEAIVFRLTWDGCEFLDAARSDTLWKKAKESIIAPAASWTFDILRDWLKAEIANGFPALR